MTSPLLHLPQPSDAPPPWFAPAIAKALAEADPYRGRLALKAKDMARCLGISRKTLWRYTAKGIFKQLPWGGYSVEQTKLALANYKKGKR
jgi:hypothetical protein